MTTVSDSPTVLKCRYRYATGCTAEFGSKPGMNAHEKQSPAHLAHRVELRACPECGTDCGSEAIRALHLSNEHGIRAGSERRQELDARQVLELLGERGGSAPVAPETKAETPAAVLPPEGKPAAAPELPVVRNILAALVDEVEALRAENAALRARNAELEAEAATFATVRNLLAPQNGTREHADLTATT